MAISRQKKEEIVEDISDRLSRKKIVIFTDYKGLDVKSLEDLRKKLKKSQIDFQVVKKTLIGLSLKNAGLDFDVLGLEGQIGIILGYEDEVTPSRLVYQFSKGNPALKILAGIVDDEVIPRDEILALAKLPSREELYAKMVWSIGAPISGFVNVLRGGLLNLVYTLNAIKNNR